MYRTVCSMVQGQPQPPGVVGSVGELSALNVNRECVCERNAHTYTFLLTRERKVRLSKSVPTPGGAALKAPPPAGVLRFHFLYTEQVIRTQHFASTFSLSMRLRALYIGAPAAPRRAALATHQQRQRSSAELSVRRGTGLLLGGDMHMFCSDHSGTSASSGSSSTLSNSLMSFAE